MGTLDKTPKIAEKVRFWEEQDRINQELIPRVLKQHELFATHVEGHEASSVQIAALEARLIGAIDLAAQQAAETARQGAIEEADRKISESEANAAHAFASLRRQAFIVPGASIAIAACSLIFALVS